MSVCLRFAGKLFYSLGPAAAKHVSTATKYYVRLTDLKLAERSWKRPSSNTETTPICFRIYFGLRPTFGPFAYICARAIKQVRPVLLAHSINIGQSVTRDGVLRRSAVSFHMCERLYENAANALVA